MATARVSFRRGDDHRADYRGDPGLRWALAANEEIANPSDDNDGLIVHGSLSLGVFL